MRIERPDLTAAMGMTAFLISYLLLFAIVVK